MRKTNKFWLSLALILGFSMQMMAQPVNGAAAKPLVSTAEKPIYYYIEQAVGQYKGHVILPNTATGQKLKHDALTDANKESAKWQIVLEDGVPKLKNAQTGKYMRDSYTYGETGNRFEVQIFTNEDFYKIYNVGTNPAIAYNDNLLNRQKDVIDEMKWYFIVAPGSEANYNEGKGNYYTLYGNITRADRYLNAINFKGNDVLLKTVAVNQQGNGVAYFDKTAEVIEVSLGNVLSISFNWAGAWMRNIAYVDWDKNLNFDTTTENERLGYNAAPESGTEMKKSIVYTVPTDRELGDYRLRVMVDWFDPPHSTPNHVRGDFYGLGGCVADVILRVTNKPTLSIDANSVIVKGDQITISHMDGATVKYTTDGSDPATSGTVQIGTTVTVTGDMTLKAIQVKDGVNSEMLEREIKTIDLTLGNEYYVVFQRYYADLALEDKGDGVPMQTQTLVLGKAEQRWKVSKGAYEGLYKLTSVAGNIVYWNGSKFTVSATPAGDAEVDLRFVVSPNADYSGYEIQRKASTGKGMNPLGGSQVGKEIGEYNLGDGGNVIKFVSTKGLLLAEIQKTQAIHDAAKVGTEFGQFSAEAKADLQTAIDGAQVEYGKPTYDGDVPAINALRAAVATFKTKIITDKNTLIGAAGKYKWYAIRSTSTHEYAKGKVISSTGRVEGNKFTFENVSDPVADAQLFRFELDGTKVKLVNKANGKYMAIDGAIASAGATFDLIVLDDAYSFNIQPEDVNAIHAQEAGSHIVNWAGNAGSASAWVFDFVKETYAPANITWRSESNNSNWWNDGGNDGDKHWWNLGNDQALIRPDIVVWDDTEFTGNNIQFANNVYPDMNVNGAAFKVNSITFAATADAQRTFSPDATDGGSINFVGTPSSIVNNSTPFHTFNLPIEISGTDLTVNTAAGCITINGVISGSGSLTKTGTHSLYLSGANTYAGKTTVSEGTLVVEGNMTMASLEIAAGASLEIAGGVQLTITGAAVNNGNIIVNSGATIVGNIEGNATVKQDVNKPQTYYIGSPVGGTVNTSNIGDAITFTESSDTWSAAAPFADPVVGKGYGVQVGKDGEGGTTTISFTGTLNSGDKTIGMTVGDRKFNFLGNPYPSFLNSVEVVKNENVEKSIWYYFKTGATYAFTTYNVPVHLSIPDAGDTDGFIPPMQGFWVKAKAEADFTFNNAMRIHKQEGSVSAFRAPQASEKQLMRLQVTNGTEKDETVILFSEAATSDWNSSKPMNPGLNIYTVKDGENLALNSRTAIEYDVETPVGVKAASGEYTFSAIKYENFGTDKAFLLDKVTNVNVNLTSESYTVNFAEAYEGTDRFAVVFPRSGVITGLEGAETTGFFAFTNNNRITVSSDAQTGMIYVFNAVGQQVAAEAISGKLTTVNTALPAGVYVVKLNNLTTKVVVK